MHAFYSKKVGATAGGYKLVMDNAPAHKAKSTLQFIRDHDIPWLSDFPPQAPDLNIIENAWAMLKDALDRSVLKTSRQQLLKQIETAWRKAVTPGRVNNLVRSFHNSCAVPGYPRLVLRPKHAVTRACATASCGSWHRKHILSYSMLKVIVPLSSGPRMLAHAQLFLLCNWVGGVIQELS